MRAIIVLENPRLNRTQTDIRIDTMRIHLKYTQCIGNFFYKRIFLCWKYEIESNIISTGLSFYFCEVVLSYGLRLRALYH